MPFPRTICQQGLQSAGLLCRINIADEFARFGRRRCRQGDTMSTHQTKQNKSTKFGGRNNLGVTGSRQGCRDHATGPLSQSAGAERLPHEQTRRLIVPGFGDDPGMLDGPSTCVTWTPERLVPFQAQCPQDPRPLAAERTLECKPGRLGANALKPRAAWCNWRAHT